jgi:hypothetical protein
MPRTSNPGAASVAYSGSRPTARADAKSNSKALHHRRSFARRHPGAVVARQLGVSRSWASREANAPGTRLLISELFEANRNG